MPTHSVKSSVCSRYREPTPALEADAIITASKIVTDQIDIIDGGSAVESAEPSSVDCRSASGVRCLHADSSDPGRAGAGSAGLLAGSERDHGSVVQVTAAAPNGWPIAAPLILPTLDTLIADAIERGALVEITHGALDRADAGCEAVLLEAIEDYHHCERVVIPEEMRAAALAKLLNLGWDARERKIVADIAGDEEIWIGAAVAEARHEGGCV